MPKTNASEAYFLAIKSNMKKIEFLFDTTVNESIIKIKLNIERCAANSRIYLLIHLSKHTKH